MKAPYLQDNEFLTNFAFMPFKSQFIKITVYNYKENPIRTIEGICTGGNINVDGKSSVRRTASLAMVALDEENDFTNIDNLLSINKKIGIEIGFLNQSKYLGKYKEYEKLWFPMGIYYIINPSITHSASQVSINLTLMDKMAGLNGSCGGVFPASTTVSSVEEVNEVGAYYEKQLCIYQIIQELVNEFGNEDLNKIFIRDIDLQAREIVKWAGDSKIYAYPQRTNEGNDRLQNLIFASSKEELSLLIDNYNEEFVKEFDYGDDIGYLITDFVWPSGSNNENALTTGFGDTVASILEKIAETLGNYEFFYDVYGNFHFQEIRNYYNTSKSTVDLKNLDSTGYLPSRVEDKAAFVFNNGNIVLNYSSSPRYDSVKNDFVIWGMRQIGNGTQMPIRMHIAIDYKPQIGNKHNVFFIKGEDTDVSAETVEKPYKPYQYKTKEQLFNDINKSHPGVQNIFYGIENSGIIYTWDYTNETLVPLRQNYKISEFKQNGIKKINFIYFYEKTEIYKNVEEMPKTISKYNDTNQMIFCLEDNSFYLWVPDSSNKENYGYWVKQSLDPHNRWILSKNTKNKIINQENDFSIEWIESKYDYNDLEREGAFRTVTAVDWRTELLLSDLENVNQPGGEPSYYYSELIEEWPKIYDIQNGMFYQEFLDHPSRINFYLDFIDTGTSLMDFAVSEIGRRSYVTNDDSLNCIFEEKMPEVIFIDSKASIEENKKIRETAASYGYPICVLESSLMEAVTIGGYNNSIYNFLQSILTQYTNYNESISITCSPIWHLEPNTRITVVDKKAGINGDYNINSFSLPLQVGGSMTINCSKILDRYI